MVDLKSSKIVFNIVSIKSNSKHHITHSFIFKFTTYQAPIREKSWATTETFAKHLRNSCSVWHIQAEVIMHCISYLNNRHNMQNCSEKFRFIELKAHVEVFHLSDSSKNTLKLIKLEYLFLLSSLIRRFLQLLRDFSVFFIRIQQKLNLLPAYEMMIRCLWKIFNPTHTNSLVENRFSSALRLSSDRKNTGQKLSGFHWSSSDETATFLRVLKKFEQMIIICLNRLNVYFVRSYRRCFEKQLNALLLRVFFAIYGAHTQ